MKGRTHWYKRVQYITMEQEVLDWGKEAERRVKEGIWREREISLKTFQERHMETYYCRSYRKGERGVSKAVVYVI